MTAADLPDQIAAPKNNLTFALGEYSCQELALNVSKFGYGVILKIDKSRIIKNLYAESLFLKIVFFAKVLYLA